MGCLSPVTSQRYELAVRSGFEKIPESVEMESLFGPCDHFIGHQPDKETQLWNSEVIVEGRYLLTMQVDVQVSKEFDEVVKIVAGPRFYVKEVSRVDVLSDGDVRVRFSKNQAKFDAQQWKQVVANRGDLSEGGIQFVRGIPIDNIAKFQERNSAPRVPIRPDPQLLLKH
jgi:hypothetical protein